jgi:hypothetical protein
MNLTSKLLGAALAASTFLTSTRAQCVLNDQGVGGTKCFDLLAGQTIDVGDVCVAVENNALRVTYTTTGCWQLTEAHLWVGNSITTLPTTKKGNPIPGQFPFKSGDITGLQTFTFLIPLSNPLINFSCPSDPVIYLMAAHAAVRCVQNGEVTQSETGWSDGSPITSQGNWATFSTFTLSCNCGGGETSWECETAFAKHATNSRCFLLDGFNRWGWTNGPWGAGTYSLDLRAGAGLCDTTKGYDAGEVTVVYNGTTVVVTFATTSPTVLEETQLYVGTLPYPKVKQGKTMEDTVAPGQFPYIHGDLNHVTTDTFEARISGSIYVIAHAVVCRPE